MAPRAPEIHPAESLPPFLYPVPSDGGPGWLSDLRARAFQTYRAHGLPTRKREAWKYTDLSFLAETAFVPSVDVEIPEPVFESVPLLDMAVPKVVLVNGVLAPSLSNLDLLPNGLTLYAFQTPPSDLRSVLEREQPLDGTNSRPMAALNLALFQHGLIIEVDAGVCIEDPIHLVSLTASGDESAFTLPRVLLSLGKGSCAHVLESLTSVGSHPTFTNAVYNVVLEDGARLTHTRLIRERAEATRIETTLADLAANTCYKNLTAILGGRLVRNEVSVCLQGPKAHADVRGLYGAGEGEHVDNTIFIDHAHPKATSNQLFKGVLDGTSRAVFQGKVLVRRGACCTDARQLHKALMLSRGAEVDMKPELFIYDDDVSCSHGATVGELDEDALFYLQSRGLDREQARTLLVEAFLNDMLEPIEPEGVRTALEKALVAWRRTVVSPGVASS